MNKQLLIGAAVTGMMALSSCSSYKKSDSKSDMGKTKGECHGINSCKGTGDCGGKNHSCAGKNSCKGKGWVKTSKADCMKKGGTFKN